MKILIGLAGILVVLMALATAAPPQHPFPWTTFAKGEHSIMQESGVKTSGHLAGCPTVVGEVQVVVWRILRANGEQWQLYATVDSPRRWVGVRMTAAGTLDHWYVGTHEGDTIQTTRSEPFTAATHGDGPCPYLTAPPA